jgi:hypothetical protein
LVETLEPPAIPYLAIALKDVVLIRENDNFIEKSELINYRKLVILGSRLRFLLRFRRVKYFWIPTMPNVAAAFRQLPASIALLKSRSANVSGAQAQQLHLNLQQQDSKSTSKFQTLKRTVLSNSTFFTPREASSPTLSRSDSKVEKQRPFTARTSKRAMVSDDKTFAAPPSSESLSPEQRSPSLSDTRNLEAVSTSALSSGTNTSSRWSRAMPRSTSGSLVSPQTATTTATTMSLLQEVVVSTSVVPIVVEAKIDYGDESSDITINVAADLSEVSFSSGECGSDDEAEKQEEMTESDTTEVLTARKHYEK